MSTTNCQRSSGEGGTTIAGVFDAPVSPSHACGALKWRVKPNSCAYTGGVRAILRSFAVHYIAPTLVVIAAARYKMRGLRGAAAPFAKPSRGCNTHIPKLTLKCWDVRGDSHDARFAAPAGLHMGDVIPAGRPHFRASYDIQLGSDFFQAHRVLIVPDQKAVLFTYNGGKVF